MLKNAKLEATKLKSDAETETEVNKVVAEDKITKKAAVADAKTKIKQDEADKKIDEANEETEASV